MVNHNDLGESFCAPANRYPAVKQLVKPATYAKEIICCLIAVAVVELVFYLSTSNDFSAYIYLKSVGEVFIAPLLPGWHLVYPPLLLLAILGFLLFLRSVRNRALRIALLFSSVLAWAALGFTTIIKYYP